MPTPHKSSLNSSHSQQESYKSYSTYCNTVDNKLTHKLTSSIYHQKTHHTNCNMTYLLTTKIWLLHYNPIRSCLITLLDLLFLSPFLFFSCKLALLLQEANLEDQCSSKTQYLSSLKPKSSRSPAICYLPY